LIALARIGRLDLLDRLTSLVLVPEAVVLECTRDPALPGALEIAKALASSPFEVGVLTLPPLRFPEGLGEGERGAISLALERDCGLLINDQSGRSFAVQHGLKVIGLPGLLIIAKQRRIIPWVRPLLEALAGQKYFISTALRAEILRRAGE